MDIQNKLLNILYLMPLFVGLPLAADWLVQQQMTPPAYADDQGLPDGCINCSPNNIVILGEIKPVSR